MQEWNEIFISQNKNQFKDFIVSSKVLKLLEENIDTTPKDAGLGSNFLKRTPVAKDIIPRIDEIQKPLHSKGNHLHSLGTEKNWGLGLAK